MGVYGVRPTAAETELGNITNYLIILLSLWQRLHDLDSVREVSHLLVGLSEPLGILGCFHLKLP